MPSVSCFDFILRNIPDYRVEKACSRYEDGESVFLILLSLESSVIAGKCLTCPCLLSPLEDLLSTTATSLPQLPLTITPNFYFCSRYTLC